MSNEKKVSFIETDEQLATINEISRKVLRQVFNRLDSFTQEFLFDDDNECYYSPSDLVIELSPDDYCYLKRFF